jgi:hypothetical protein
MGEKRRYLLLFAVAPLALVAIVTALSAPRAMAAPLAKSANYTVAQSTAAGTVHSPSIPTIIMPSCGAPNDGAKWVSPAGITYICRYVQGVGWRWVPFLGCRAGMTLYATQRSSSLVRC